MEPGDGTEVCKSGRNQTARATPDGRGLHRIISQQPTAESLTVRNILSSAAAKEWCWRVDFRTNDRCRFLLLLISQRGETSG